MSSPAKPSPESAFPEVLPSSPVLPTAIAGGPMPITKPPPPEGHDMPMFRPKARDRFRNVEGNPYEGEVGDQMHEGDAHHGYKLRRCVFCDQATGRQSWKQH